MLDKTKKIAGTVTLAIVAIVVTMAFRAKISNTASKKVNSEFSTLVTAQNVVSTTPLESGSGQNTPPDSDAGQIRERPLSEWDDPNDDWFNGNDVPFNTGESLTISLYGN